MKKFRFSIVSLLLLLLLAEAACIGEPNMLPSIPQPITWMNRPDNFPLPDFSGKITILGFYTEDSSGCIKILPIVLKLIQQYGNRIQFIGVYSPLPKQEETIAEIKQLLKEKNVPYPVMLDHNTEISRLFRINRWPTVVIADRDKKIIHRLYGSREIINQLPDVLNKAAGI